MNAHEIRALSHQEIQAKLSELYRKKAALVLLKKTGQEKNTAVFNAVRRAIARLLTVQKERQLTEKGSV
ncbi:MAG: 50S ribosomal protein L29 [Gammaproteobacteria bacterium]|nr:50S ribosomal protein L29 [Gammaproteobacteria bacterium]